MSEHVILDRCGKWAVKNLRPRVGYLGAALRGLAMGGVSPPGMLSVINPIILVSDSLVPYFSKKVANYFFAE